ncbi:MAG: sigma-54 interaction domain-containing protein [Desulfobaccales bacterium]
MSSQDADHLLMDRIPETILHSIPIGILFCTPDKILRFINKTYAEYLGIDPKDYIGKPITECIPEARIGIVMGSGKAEMGDLGPITTKKGKINLIVNRLPVFGPNGKVIGGISQSLFGDPRELKEVAKRIAFLEDKINLCKLKIGSALSAKYKLTDIKAQSASIFKAKELIKRYAKTDSSVMILGPTGTGKELFAHALHQESYRADAPFVSINCAAIPPDLLESELFGYVPGAFTGARKEGKIGLIELADKGTLFLDEICDMPLSAQAKLLRVLEEKMVCRLGNTRSNRVDFRLVVATNRKLKAMILEGNFREDLYYRFSTISITIPPLCERKEDIPVLVDHFLERFERRLVTCSKQAMEALIQYNWPGNVRELKNVIESSLSLCKNNTIEVADLSHDITDSPNVFSAKQPEKGLPKIGRAPLSQFREANEQILIIKVLKENNWNMATSAKVLQIGRATLYEKLKKYQISKTTSAATNSLVPRGTQE